MIYTVTFNPAIDYVMNLENKLIPGLLNRSSCEQYYCGGKGINVSCVLARLGLKSNALGFVAGFTGDVIEKSLKEQGIYTEFIRLKEGISRINVKVKSGQETEINAQGPCIEMSDFNLLLEQLKKLKKHDILILSGSIPASLPDDTFEIILSLMTDKNIMTIVDAEKNLLTKTLKYHPFLIKPNLTELCEIFNIDESELSAKDMILSCGIRLQKMGALNVLISQGADGALLITENGAVYQTNAPTGTVLNSVGSGDSMIAGFLAEYLRHEDFETALKMGTAAGSATAFSAGLARQELIMQLYHNM